MCKMAIQFLDDLGIPHEGFKASVGWVRRFIKRKDLACRRVSTQNQHNPDDINQKVIRFILYMRSILERHRCCKVWACDETPVFYDLVSNRTFDKKRAKVVKINTSGGSKKMVTVIPVASSEGEKKPITIIFKGKGKTSEDKQLAKREDCVFLYSDNR